jgi:hypothetical protein
MGMLRGSALAGAAVAVRSGLAGLFFLAGIGAAGAADISAPPLSYTYFSVEGGYIYLDGEDVQAFFDSPEFGDVPVKERSIDISDGFHGRAELGHVWDTGIVNGIGAYVQGWEGEDEDISEDTVTVAQAYKHGNNDGIFDFTSCNRDGLRPCARGVGDLDRSLIEAGLRFIHAGGDAPDLGGITLGLEPFVAFVKEDASSTTGSTFDGPFEPSSIRSSDLDATAYGALFALDGRHHVLERTVLTARVAAGAYYMDAGADTSFVGGRSADDGLSSDFFGFRGQLALGLEQMLTEAFSIGVIGRLDYWSDYPSINWTDWPEPDTPAEDIEVNSISDEDFLALSIGARISVNFK